MKLAALRGNSVHVPENTRAALVSAYTGGADLLQLDVQLTEDGRLVVSHDATTERLTGEPRPILETNVSDLRALDVSTTFRPRGSPGFSYTPVGRRPLRIETFPELLDLLPREAELLIELRPEPAAGGHGDEYVQKVVDALEVRGRTGGTIVFSEAVDLLAAARRAAPALRTAVTAPELVTSSGADGLVTSSTAAGGSLPGGLRVGAILVPDRDPPVPTQAEFEAAANAGFYAIGTASTFDVASFAYPWWTSIDESFAGTDFDAARFALGYAKGNPYTHVFQDDGIHVKISPYDGPIDTVTSSDPVEHALQDLQQQLWYALMDWPFYSGGGFGVLGGIDGSFGVEVDIAATVAQQATMCELAVTNVDPAAHHAPWNPDGTPNLPKTARDKAAFYNPHGAPPFVGSEHDEDDGYRINWNLGGEYDDNQYGRPVGDGTVTDARLRLERRGPFFAAYYRNAKDATDWVCTGVARNESMNDRVFLRVAGKRWRQEREDDPTKYYPVPANEFVFKNLKIDRVRA